MFARVIRIQATPEQVEPVIRLFREQGVPIVRQAKGFKGQSLLADRKAGKGMSISLWETEADAEAFGAATPQQPAHQLRTQAAQTLGLPALQAETYEVAAQSPEDGLSGAEGRYARVIAAQGAPDQVEASIRMFREQAPRAQKIAGFRGNYLLLDRKAAKGIAISLWETEGDAKAADAAAAQLAAQAMKDLKLTELPKAEIYEVAAQA
jgi:heme-degrading monooxygenase HmoA